MAKAKKVVNEELNTVTIISESTGEQYVLNLNELDADIVAKLALHGASQKLGDSYANPEISPDESVPSVIGNLVAGIWTSKSSRGSVLAEALAMASGQNLEDCIEALSGMHDERKDQLKKEPAIKAALAQISARKAAEKAAKLSKVETEGSDFSGLFS